MTNTAHTHGKTNWQVRVDLIGQVDELVKDGLNEFQAYDLALEMRSRSQYLKDDVNAIWFTNGDRFEVVWSR